MRIIFDTQGRATGTATDDYTGPDAWAEAPEGFDLSRLSQYTLADGTVILAVPAAVTMRQARLALLGAGLLDDVDAAINAMPSPQKEAAKIEWEYSQEVQRHNGVVAALGPLLGLTDAQIDDLFLAAAQL